MEIITFKNGHQIFKERFDNMLQYFKNHIETQGFKVIKAENPKTEADYSYLINGNIENISKSLFTVFGKAGLSTSLINLAKNCFIIKLKA